MRRLWTDLNEPSFIEDYTSLTSDVLLGELQEPNSYMTWRASDFTGWSIIPVAENVAALEDSDPLEPAPFILDERNLGQSQAFLVFLPLHKKSDHFFVRFGDRATTSPYTLVQGRVEPSLHRTRFHPDFFNIKKFVTHIIGRIPASPIKQQQPSKIKRTIPTTISPQVIIESEEKNLTKDLEAAVRIAEESYSTVKAIDVNIEHDPEIVDRKTIRFTLRVSGKPETVLEDETLFRQRLRSNIDVCVRELITVTYNWEK